MPPKRIVSLSPTASEMLWAIGAGGLQVARSLQCDYPEEVKDLHPLGHFGRPSFNRLKALRPDLVLGHEPLYPGLAEKIQEAGIELMLFAPRKVEDITENINRLGRRLGRLAAAQSVAGAMDARVRTARRAVAGVAPGGRPTVLRLLELDPPLVPGPDSFMTDLVKAAGGVPPEFSPGGAYRRISFKDLAAIDPDFIYLCGEPAQKAEELAAVPELHELSAVKNRRILVFPCGLTCRPGPRTGQMIRALVARLHPERIGPESDDPPVWQGGLPPMKPRA